MARREFQFQEAGSDKFWTIDLKGKSFKVQFGRAGTTGQTQTKTFGSAAEAEKACAKLIAEKLKKGYKEVGSEESTPANPASPAAIPMAKLSSVKEWQQLHNRLTADVRRRRPSHPGADAVKTAVRKFESSSGHKLPSSYKAFAQVFGPGELGGYFRIWIPGDTKCDYDLGTQHGMARETHSPAADFEQGELLARLLFFASTIGGEFVGWDPLDVTDSTASEYRVYYITRSANARAVAASFPEFVTDIALKNRLHEFFGWENQEEEDWPPQTFLPY